MEFPQNYSADTFGVPDIDRDTKGVRVLDLIRWRMNHPARIPLREAAEEVICKLESLGDRLQLYRTSRTGWPEPTTAHEYQTRQVRTVDPFYDALAHRQSGSWLNPDEPRRVAYFVKQQVSWTECLRINLVVQPKPRLMEAGPFVSLVISQAVAEALFATEAARESGDELMPSDAEGLIFEPWPIDERLWGKPLTNDAHLVAVPRLVHLMEFAHCDPVNPCIRQVIGMLEAAAEIPLYLTQRDEFARMVMPDDGWPGVDETGRRGLLKLAQATWLKRRGGFDEYAASIQHGQLAITYDDSKRLFAKEWAAMMRGAERAKAEAPPEDIDSPSDAIGVVRELPRLVAVEGPRPASDCGLTQEGDGQSGRKTVFQPAGGIWPHVPGEDWTDAKREALFKMRHISRMTDAELAKEAGIKAGQQISQLIGSRISFKRWMNGERLLPSNSWEPSAALLQECGLSPRNLTVKRS